LQPTFVGVDQGELVNTVLRKRVRGALAEGCDIVSVVFCVIVGIVIGREMMITGSRFCNQSDSRKDTHHVALCGYISAQILMSLYRGYAS
jgi:hypothetical protein